MAMVIQKGRTGFFALSIKDKTQWDRFRDTVIPVEHFGKTVEVEHFADQPFGAKIASAVRPLHFGDITGLSSKINSFIACLFATSFPITGVMFWGKKLYYRRKKTDCESGWRGTRTTQRNCCLAFVDLLFQNSISL
jgi:uncharacterized iron-regulated membrane protein